MKICFSQKANHLLNKPLHSRLIRFRSAVCILLVVCILTLNGFAYQPSNEASSSPNDLSSTVIDTINLYAPTDICHEVSNQISLKSFSNPSCTYTLYILEPYGYAIFLSNTSYMLEACLQPDARIPIDESVVADYYYGGPGHCYFIVDGEYTHATSKHTISQETIDCLRVSEARVLSSVLSDLDAQASTAQQHSRSAATPVQVSEFVAQSYFQNLTNFGNNVNGTCVVVATAMLLGYYDHYVNDSYVRSGHEQGTGTNDAFHLYLNNLVYGTPTPSSGGTNLQTIAPTINNYLDSEGIITELHCENHPLSYRNLADNIILYIKNNMPVVASMSEAKGASWDHTVLIYGVTYNTDDPAGTAMYTAHMGWWPGTTSGTSYLLRANWFWECATIDCGTSGHAQGLIWNDVDSVFHDITCHCGIYLKERHILSIDTSTGYCTKCGRRVNHFPEINNVHPELK